MNDQYFVRISGQVRGPFTWPQLQDLKQRGRLQGFHELSSDRATWVDAASLPELFPPPAPQPSAPSPAPPSGSEQWFYADASGQRCGPVPRQQLTTLLQSGAIQPESLVWMKGLADWQPISQALPELLTRPESVFQFGATSRAQANTEWRSTRVGLTLALVATFVFAGSIVMFCLAFLIAVVNAGPGELSFARLLETMRIMAVVTRLLIFAAVILETIGFGFCCTAPARTGTRGLAIASLILAIASLVLDFVFFVSVLSGGSGEGWGPDGPTLAFGRAGYLLILQLFSMLAFLAYRFVFVLFLRALAVVCRATSLAQNLIYLAILYGVLVLLAVVSALVGFLGDQGDGRQASIVVLVLSFALLILGLGWLAWYLVLLFQSRAVLARGSRS